MKRRVLLTGGSRGIGASIARTFETAGYEVVAPVRGVLDLNDLDSVRKFGAGGNANFDILVNNAGINTLNELEQISAGDWEQMLRINLTAPMLLMQMCAPFMKAQNWGRIVNISSILSLVSKEARSAYSTTKSGLNGLTRSAAVELGPYGILVNALCPGYIETDLTRANNTAEQLANITAQIPTQRLASPEEIAQYVSFLCSEQNTYMTGQMVVVDGGFTCR